MIEHGQDENNQRAASGEYQDPRFLCARYHTETSMDLYDGMEQRIRRWKGEVFHYDEESESIAADFEFVEFWVDWEEGEKGNDGLDTTENFFLMDSETQEAYDTLDALVSNWPGWDEPVDRLVLLTRLSVREPWWGVGVESYFLNWFLNDLEFGLAGPSTAVTWLPWAGVDSIEDNKEKEKHQDLLDALVRDAGFVRLGRTPVWAKHLAYSRQPYPQMGRDE